MKYWRRFIVEDTKKREGCMNDLIMVGVRQGVDGWTLEQSVKAAAGR